MAPGHAGPFYEKLGFAYNGKIDEGEHEMVLRLIVAIDTNFVQHENRATLDFV
jgi:hypothetical protein